MKTLFFITARDSITVSRRPSEGPYVTLPNNKGFHIEPKYQIFFDKEEDAQALGDPIGAKIKTINVDDDWYRRVTQASGLGNPDYLKKVAFPEGIFVDPKEFGARKLYVSYLLDKMIRRAQK